MCMSIDTPGKKKRRKNIRLLFAPRQGSGEKRGAVMKKRDVWEKRNYYEERARDRDRSNKSIQRSTECIRPRILLLVNCLFSAPRLESLKRQRRKRALKELQGENGRNRKGGGTGPKEGRTKSAAREIVYDAPQSKGIAWNRIRTHVRHAGTRKGEKGGERREKNREKKDGRETRER